MVEKVNKTLEEWKKTVAGEIWKEIKDVAIDIYALPNQTVKDHVENKLIPGDVLFLKAKSPAAITSLETAVGKKFIVNTTDGGFITVEKKEEVPVDDEYVYFQRKGRVDKIRKKDLL